MTQNLHCSLYDNSNIIIVSASPTTGVVQFPKTDDFYEVFVSAIDNPGHFWVQLITEDSPQLDKLTTNLTRLHSSSESQAVLNAFKVSLISGYCPSG